MSDDHKAPEKNLRLEEKFKSNAGRATGKAGKFVQALWKNYEDIARISYEFRWSRSRSFSDLHAAYAQLCDVDAENTVTLDDFWNPKFARAIEKLFGPENARTLCDICGLILEAPYSHSSYRPSYRSRHAGDYADIFFMALVHAIDYHCYELPLTQAIRQNHTEICGVEDRLALALRCGDQEIGALVEASILGESGEIKLSYPIIRAVVKSGKAKYLELLGKLLIAAKGQEGIRQSILENADCGSVQTHAYYIKLVIDNNLARFSSVIRAFATWTGQAYDNAKPATIDKCLKLAYSHLRDLSKYEDGLKSADTLEIYMALWAQASRDIHAAKDGAENLIDAPEKYRRLVGWHFLFNTIHKSVTHKIAMKHIDVREPEELAWICCCLYRSSDALNSWGWEQREKMTSFPNPVLPERLTERKSQFDKLCDVLDFIGNKKTLFEGSVFPWTWVRLEASDAAKCLIGLAGYDRNADMIMKFSKYLPQMGTDLRQAYYVNLLDPSDHSQRKALLAGLSDKSAIVKEVIIKRFSKEQLQSEDIKYLCETLITQSASLRKAAMLLLGKQAETLIRPAIQMLIHAANDKLLLAGVELLHVFGRQNPELVKEYRETLDELGSRATLPKDVAILLEHFNQDAPTDDDTPKNGFGLYDPNSLDFDRDIWAKKRPDVPTYSKAALKKLLDVSKSELRDALLAIRDVLLEHKGMECETESYDGSKYKVMIGDNMHWLPLKPDMKHQTERRGIDAYYLADEIMAALETAKISPLTIAKILCYGSSGLDYRSEFTPEAKRIFDGLPLDGTLNFNQYVEPMSGIIRNILASVLETEHNGVFEFALSVWKSLVELIPEQDVLKPFQTKKAVRYGSSRDEVECMLEIGILSSWKSYALRFIETDAQFAAFWNEAWYEYLLTDKQYAVRYNYIDLLRAHKSGLIGDDGLFFELLAGKHAVDNIRFFTAGTSRSVNLQKKAKEDYPFFDGYLEKTVERIVAIEEKRGELPTPLTPVAAGIGHFSGGVKHLAALIAALGKDNFHRGYSWYGHNHTKRTTLSVLLKNCYPLQQDTPEELKAALKLSGITERRLLQAVMYAPQWADMAEQATGISGLASAVWLFHAHINERFSAEKETKVALYSPISQQQFADGTFDKDWFLDAYASVGEKIFSELYKNAKYITESNSAHRRSQLYVDAVLGRLSKSETESEIHDRRNQEKLRAYALIPLDSKNPGDALARYEFIQKYAKESKQFGAQRQASEKKAVLIALQNLALTTGFGDADRMVWYLESEKMDGLRPLMEAQDVGGVNIGLEFDHDGAPALCVSKEGKPLKALPKAFAKHEIALEINAAVKDLKDQRKRAKSGLEMAMISRTAFSVAEIQRLLDHPALRFMVSALVFVSNDHTGFPILNGKQLCLVSSEGIENKLPNKATLLIAHPYDLIEHKCWSAYQQYIFNHQIVQPFKQVFREYYPITEDELAEVNVSRRYAGQQVQPQKTVALLKTRSWTVDYEEGLQRVYHKENLIARMYAMADWFSPADIEAPTLEVVRFFSRDQNKPMAFTDVPPIIFSEVMRDIDLVVSVAHVGGVDPEASHSTVEMRIAIAKELLSLLKIANVTFQTAHAQIKGHMGNYSVHMGSGVMHQSGVGMLAVLPVHSQARGRIFLPFADDDPKTAEIMSKILLFADDTKIKDPAILQQIGS